jgi:hypothetical protein
MVITFELLAGPVSLILVSPTELSLHTNPLLQGDVLLEDVDYTSEMNTPGTYDVRSKLTVLGTISSIVWEQSTFSWKLVALWEDPGIANQVILGDLILDSAGRVFEVSYIDPVDKWAVEAKVKERSTERYGIAPVEGDANLFRPTQGEGLFTGTVFNSVVTTSMWTRDNWILEKWVGPEVQSGSVIRRDSVSIANEHLASKSFELTYTPRDPETVMVIPVGGVVQDFGVDYTIVGKTIIWEGLGLDGQIGLGDKFLCFYDS